MRSEKQRARGGGSKYKSEYESVAHNAGRVFVLALGKARRHGLRHGERKSHCRQCERDIIDAVGDGVYSVALVSKKVGHRNAVDKADYLRQYARQGQYSALHYKRVSLFFRQVPHPLFVAYTTAAGVPRCYNNMYIPTGGAGLTPAAIYIIILTYPLRKYQLYIVRGGSDKYTT
ncbi:hypothetical protein SDC9_128144 [bioreactor metagenome]|uniref:Uncharacterized protein n=1 Tax=bioreactor metagenome TaxID=1076179 RepID=A0A645CWL8_9ZZZZ